MPNTPWYKSRIVTLLAGGALVTVGALVPAAGAYLIPAGIAALGWAVKHPADKVPRTEEKTKP